MQEQRQQPTHQSGIFMQAQKHVSAWMKSNSSKKLPMEMPQLYQSYRIYISQNRLKDQDQFLFTQLKEINLKAIRQQFNMMMQIVLMEIQPGLNQCFKRGSLVYSYDIIEKNLDRDIFPIKYRLREIRQQGNGVTPGGNSSFTQLGSNTNSKSIVKENHGKEFGGNQDMVFAQLFEIMYELLAEYERHYKLSKGDNLEQAAFESLLSYVQQNPESYLVQFDTKQSQNNIPLQNQDFSLVDVLEGLLDDKSQDNQNGSKGDKSNRRSKVERIINKLTKIRENDVISNIGGKVVDNAWAYAGAIFNYAAKLHPSGKGDNQAERQPPKQLTQSTLKLIKDHLKTNIPTRRINESQIQQLVKLASGHTSKQIAMGIKQEYKLAMIDAVTDELEKDQCSFDQMKSQVIREIMIGIDLSNQQMQMSRIKLKKMSQSSSSHSQNQNTLNNFEQWSRVMLLLYRSVEKDYDPYRRRFLKKIFRHFNCQNGMPADAVSVLMVIESESFPHEQRQSQVLKMIRSQNSMRRSLSNQKEREEGLSQADLAFEHEINRIYLFQFQKKYEVQRIELVRLSKPGVKRRVINLLISGFLSQDTDKIDQWRYLVSEMPDSEIYSVCWASKTSLEMLHYAYNGIKDVIFTDVGLLGHIGGPYIRAAAVIRRVYQKYHENPFQPAFQTAKLTGYYLAQLIISTFKGHIINLMGFSLGTEVLRCCLQRLNERKSIHMVNKIVAMGGVADTHQFMELFQKCEYPLDVTNLQTTNDSVLRYLFRIAKPGNSPIGLYKMIKAPQQGPQKMQKENFCAQSHTVRNIDCTDFVSGHIDFRAKMKLIGRIIDAKEE